MSMKIVMGYDGNVPFGPETERINRAYAEKRGHKFVCYHHFPDPNRDVYWNRIRIFQQEIATCEALWWIDADAFFLRDDLELPVPTTNLAFSTDWNGICCGVMALRNSAWTERFLDAWLLLGDIPMEKIKASKFDNDQFREQTTVKAMRYFWPAIDAHVSHVSEGVVQSPTSKYHADALILHMWANWCGAERCAATISRFKADGYKLETLQRPPNS